jgi:hypothetical protein
MQPYFFNFTSIPGFALYPNIDFSPHMVSAVPVEVDVASWTVLVAVANGFSISSQGPLYIHIVYSGRFEVALMELEGSEEKSRVHRESMAKVCDVLRLP